MPCGCSQGVAMSLSNTNQADAPLLLRTLSSLSTRSPPPALHALLALCKPLPTPGPFVHAPLCLEPPLPGCVRTGCPRTPERSFSSGACERDSRWTGGPCLSALLLC